MSSEEALSGPAPILGGMLGAPEVCPPPLPPASHWDPKVTGRSWEGGELERLVELFVEGVWAGHPHRTIRGTNIVFANMTTILLLLGQNWIQTLALPYEDSDCWQIRASVKVS